MELTFQYRYFNSGNICALEVKIIIVFCFFSFFTSSFWPHLNKMPLRMQHFHVVHLETPSIIKLDMHCFIALEASSE